MTENIRTISHLWRVRFAVVSRRSIREYLLENYMKFKHTVYD